MKKFRCVKEGAMFQIIALRAFGEVKQDEAITKKRQERVTCQESIFIR